MNEIIYKGLKLRSSKCKYFQLKQGKFNSVTEDNLKSLLTLTFTPGITSKTFSEVTGIEWVGGDFELTPIDNPKKFTETYITLNGLKFRKLTYDEHTINLIIVKDSESRVVQDYGYTTIVVSEKDYRNQEFINYLFYSGGLKFLRPVGAKPKGCWEIRDFPRIKVGDRDVVLESDNETVFDLRRKYNDYVIREIDYQDQFLLEVRRILEDYGVELVRRNREQAISKTNYIDYQILQTPISAQHPTVYLPNGEENLLSKTIGIEFNLHFTDMVMFFDFKSQYTNVNLLSNFCTFYTTDKYGKRWAAGIKWSKITEDFNHQYQQDDMGHYGNQCSFRAEIFFTEAIDDRYRVLEEIICRLEEAK